MSSQARASAQRSKWEIRFIQRDTHSIGRQWTVSESESFSIFYMPKYNVCIVEKHLCNYVNYKLN